VVVAGVAVVGEVTQLKSRIEACKQALATGMETMNLDELRTALEEAANFGAFSGDGVTLVSEATTLKGRVEACAQELAFQVEAMEVRLLAAAVAAAEELGWGDETAAKRCGSRELKEAKELLSSIQAAEGALSAATQPEGEGVDKGALADAVETAEQCGGGKWAASSGGGRLVASAKAQLAAINDLLDKGLQ